MTRIAILGSGNVARALAGGLAEAGHSVVIGSRHPRGELIGPAEAAAGAEVVINATPGRVSVELLQSLARELAGKILVDVANAVVTGPDGFAEALVYPGGSLAEELQRALPATMVVKTLNTVGPATAMVAPKSPPAAFLSGDDEGARKVVAGLLTDLGWPPEAIIDLGDVTTARAPEAFVLMVRSLVRVLGPVPFGLAVISDGSDGGGAGAALDDLRVAGGEDRGQDEAEHLDGDDDGGRPRGGGEHEGQ
jgi:predicted dinucleotide-binding enzyme